MGSRIRRKFMGWAVVCAMAVAPLGVLIAQPSTASAASIAGSCSRNVSPGYGLCGWDPDASPYPTVTLCIRAHSSGGSPYWFEFMVSNGSGGYVKSGGPWERTGTNYVCATPTTVSYLGSYVAVSNQGTVSPVGYDWYIQGS